MPDYEGGPSLRRTGMRMPSEKVGVLSLKADIDPAPTPWPFATAFALLAILFFVFLQIFLPVTHVRHPLDPHRNWIPVHQLKARTSDKAVLDLDSVWATSEGSKKILIVVMTKETDLRPIFVVLNSTISNTKVSENLEFCVILPSSVPKSESLKLIMVFSNSKIEVIRDGLIIEKMRSYMPVEGASERNVKLLDMVPFYLMMLFPRYERFVYLESDAVVQGDIQDLIQLDMQGNPVAGIEDCTRDFETFFSMNLLEAARLSSGNDKPQLPLQPYEPKTCLLDKGTLVIDQKVWRETNITKVVHWWIAMYHKTEENLYSNGHVELPVQLALYQKREGLDSSWNVREPLTLAKASAAKLIHFDKQHKPWHQTKPTNFEKDVTGLWWKYISPSTNTMFNTQSNIPGESMWVIWTCNSLCQGISWGLLREFLMKGDVIEKEPQAFQIFVCLLVLAFRAFFG